MSKLALVLMLVSPLAFAAPIDGSGLLSLLVTLVIVGLILWLCWWFVAYIALPEPFNKVAKVLIALVALIFLINLLMSLVGSPFIKF